MFENKEFEGIYYSRFIASWVNTSNEDPDFWKMKKWLADLEINGKHMDDRTITDIFNLATNGKLELEDHAKNWRKEHK